MASSGYTAITFIANEQPTTAKWNLIGSNDASFNTMAGMEDNVLALRHIPDALITPLKMATHVKIGTISGASVLNTTGNKNITGVGFKPQLVKFYSQVATGSSANIGLGGMDKAGNQFALAGSHGSGSTGSARSAATNRCIIVQSSGSTTVVLDASYVSMNTDGFTINVNTAGGIDLAYEAWG